MPDLSVIIPAYNEERRLPATLSSVYGYLEKTLKETGRTYEILVVDDGSHDGTCEVVEEFARHQVESENEGEQEKIRLVSYAPNQGKGFAVRTGMLKARGDYLLMNDADGSSPIEEVERLLEGMKPDYKVVIGSRAKEDPTAKVNALFYRKYIGNTFNLIVQSLLLPGVKDTQCGFKLFERNAAQDIFSVARLNGYAFDVELLYIARLRGYKLHEVAINWNNMEGSKVNVLTDSPRMLMEVLGITVGAWFGTYKRKIADSGS